VAVAPQLVVLRALGLGDLLTAVPALRGLRRTFPAHRLVLLTPDAFAPLVRGMVDSTVHVDARTRPPGALPDVGPVDVAVNLHGAGPDSHRALLGLRPRRLVAFRHPAVAASGPSWRRAEHEVRRWCRMLASAGILADPAELDIEAPRPAPPLAVRGATLLHPGAGAPARRWPAERWAAVARTERARGRRVVVTGDASERSLAARVAQDAGLPESAVLAGATTVEELAAVVAGCARVICGDTGVAHLATALGTPSLVLFGPSSPAEWAPPAGRPRHRVMWAGRRGDPLGRQLDPGLAALSVEAVLRELKRVGR
jgi:ADP-heptose:LPS heptosyltransferase